MDANNRVKVLHVIPSVGPLRGGPTVMVRTMTRGLAHAGLEVHIATTDDNERDRLNVPHGLPLKEEGIIHWYFPRQTRFYSVSWPLSRWLAQYVRSYDLVHIHALFSYAAIPAAFWASRRGIPYIVRPLGTLNRWGIRNRHPWLKRLSLRLIERRILAGAAVIHYTSQQERLEAAELGVTQRSVVIPNAVDMRGGCYDLPAGRFRAQYPQLAGRKVILFLSRLDPKKGLDLLLPAFARMRAQYPEVALVVVGNGDPAFVAALQQDAARLGIASDIVWTGFLAGEEKAAALADADAFVLPSYSENFGIAVVEAMAAGLPVVISNQVAIYREVQQAGAGLVVGLRPKEIAAALEHLIADDHLRYTIGQRGAALVREQFAWDKVARKVVVMYEDVIRAAQRLCTTGISDSDRNSLTMRGT